MTSTYVTFIITSIILIVLGIIFLMGTFGMEQELQFKKHSKSSRKKAQNDADNLGGCGCTLLIMGLFFLVFTILAIFNFI